MISRYTYEKGDVTTLSPEPVFYDSFYFAGDDMLNGMVKNVMLLSEDSALRRSRLTANTAREGRPSDEQADLTETQTPLASNSRWNTVPLTFWTLRFSTWGMACSGLLMRTSG